MTGNGSQASPYIVMDAYDFNSLRTLINTSGSYPYVELGDDIDMSVYPVFTQFPTSYCNFDGKNHRIYNLNISTANASASTGLFGSLYAAQVKNIFIEGSITAAETGSYGVGMLAGYLYFGTIDAKVSNIHCSGAIVIQNFSSMGKVGGICGNLQNSNSSNTNAALENCSFHGTITGRMTYSITSINDQMPYIGGIAGWMDTYSGASGVPVSITKCISNVTVVIDSSTAHMGVGGIVGLLRSYSGKLVTVDRCISQMEVHIATAAASPRTLCIGGIAAYSYYSTSNISRCAAHLVFQYDLPSTIAAVYFAGILAYYSAACNISQSYSVMSINNPNNKPLPAAFYVDGIQGNGTRTITASFYDAEVLAASFSGSVVDSSRGITTAEMKSQAFLESQGWVF